MRENITREGWLDTAVSGIRFGPDRREARAELAAHIEDKTESLRRRFPDIPQKEAEQRALDGMGDPQEVKAQLAKVHRPWLGWLWTASRWAVWVMILVAAYCNLLDTSYENSIWGRTSEQTFCNVQDGERASLGEYTFQITGAACLDRAEERGGEDNLQVVVRVSSPRFWERIEPDTVYNSLTAVGPDGTRHPMNSETRKNYGPVNEHGLYAYLQYIYTGARLSRWGFTWREFAVYIPAEGWEPGDRVSLEFDSAVGEVSLSVPVTERVSI